MSKTFDLNKGMSSSQTHTLHSNVALLMKKYGTSFNIKYNKHVIPVDIIKLKIPSGISYFRMQYDPPHRTTELYPLAIDFIDPILIEKNNNIYIASINKTDKLSGTDLVQLCIKFGEVMGVEKMFLGDGTRIRCNQTNEELDLSYLKLIERGMTFYTKLGFKFEVNNPSTFFYNRFTNIKDLEQYINNILKTTFIIFYLIRFNSINLFCKI